MTGKVAFYGEVEVLKDGVKATVPIPEGIPEVGGKWGVEINPLHFTWEVAAQPRFGDGAGLTGSFELGGKWEAEAKCGTKRKGDLSAAITGAGEFYPQIKLTDVSAELAGSLTFLTPRVPLLCQWTGCCHTGYCPYFQASIKPKIEGTVGMEEGEPALIAGLKFKNAELNIGVTVAGTVGAGSEGSIYYIAGTIGGTPYIVIQFPGDASSSCLNEYIKEVAFDLEAQFVVECAWWKREESWTFNIFRCPEEEKAYAIAMPSGKRQMDLVDRAYLRDPGGYCVFPESKGKQALASVGGLPAPILNVGSGAMPAIAATSERGLLLFVYDDAAKPIGKHQEIHWARWSGSAWVDHAPLTDNFQPDLFPAAAIDGAGKEVAVWVRAPEPTGTETGPRDILPGTEIVFSSYDSSSGAWTATQAITANTQADLLPWFERAPSGSLRVCWLTSALNAIPVWHDEQIVPNLDVMASDWNGTTFGPPYQVAGNLQTVTAPSLMRTTTHEFMAYTRDMDGNSATAEDREVMVRVRTLGGAWGSDQQLTEDTVVDAAALVVMDGNEVPMVVWVKRMVPVVAPDGTETRVDQLWSARWNGASWDLPILGFETEGIAELKVNLNSAGRVTALWESVSSEFSDIFYSVFDTAGGQWSQPQQITHDGGAETMLSLAESGGNLLAAYIKRRIDLTDPSGLPRVGLADLYLVEHAPTRDLSVGAEDLSFMPSPPVPGAPAGIRANVHLSGDFAVTNVRVEFYDGDPTQGGSLIGTQTIASMLPGRTASADVTWNVPADSATHTVHVLVDPSNEIAETDDTINNHASIVPFKPDLRVSGPCFLGCPLANTTLIGFTVRNDGQTTAGPSVAEVRRGDAAGPVLFTTTFGSLQPGESVSAQFAWDITGEIAGRIVLAAIADAGNQVSESNESNNVAATPFPLQPDLRLEQQSVRARPGLARVVVRNVGATSGQATTVRASQGGQALGQVSIPSLDVGGEVDAAIEILDAKLGTLIELTVNPDSSGSDEITLTNNAATVIVTPLPAADFDLDNDVDGDDLVVFAACARGAAVPSIGTETCQQADFDRDSDVDQSDFGIFQRCFSGAGKPTDLMCAK